MTKTVRQRLSWVAWGVTFMFSVLLAMAASFAAHRPEPHAEYDDPAMVQR